MKRAKMRETTREKDRKDMFTTTTMLEILLTEKSFDTVLTNHDERTNAARIREHVFRSLWYHQPYRKSTYLAQNAHVHHVYLYKCMDSLSI